MQAGSQVGPHFHLPLVPAPLPASGEVVGLPAGCWVKARGAAHTPTACHAVPKTSPHPLVAQKPQGFTVWTHQTVWSKWPPGMKPSRQGPGWLSPGEARRHLGSNPSVLASRVSLGLPLHPPSPGPSVMGTTGTEPMAGVGGRRGSLGGPVG